MRGYCTMKPPVFRNRDLPENSVPAQHDARPASLCVRPALENPASANALFKIPALYDTGALRAFLFSRSGMMAVRFPLPYSCARNSRAKGWSPSAGGTRHRPEAASRKERGRLFCAFYAALSWSWSEFQTFNDLFCRKGEPEATASNSRYNSILSPVPAVFSRRSMPFGFSAHPPGLCRRESLPPLLRPHSARRFPHIPLIYSGLPFVRGRTLP